MTIDDARRRYLPTQSAALAPLEQGERVVGLDRDRLDWASFGALAGKVGGHDYVKIVLDRVAGVMHFLDDARWKFHSDYVGEAVVGVRADQVDAEIDAFNEAVYMTPERRFCIGMLVRYEPAEVGQVSGGGPLLALELVEVDTMEAATLRAFFAATRRHVDPPIALFFRPNSDRQEKVAAEIDPRELPRLLARDLSASFVALNPGEAWGRLRVFADEGAFRAALSTLEPSDIVAMDRVPEDVPQVAGMLSAQPATPLSHVNVLAHGWGAPNAVQRGVLDELRARGLDGAWVRYRVDRDASAVVIERAEPPPLGQRKARPRVHLERPLVSGDDAPEEAPLARLRAYDGPRYGTKAALLGELIHVAGHGSPRLLGFYLAKRPPRDDLLPYLRERLGLSPRASQGEIDAAARALVERVVRVPRGVAVSFAAQRELLEASPAVQRAIGRLSMALELGARDVGPLCDELSSLVREAPVPARLRDSLEQAVAEQLGGAKALVVRSSSNAEDLEHFSAAGLYTSVGSVTTGDGLARAIREVFASLFSPRAVRLRAEAGIALERTAMGAIIQEQVEGPLGGVMVTTSPINRDFRDVFVNASRRGPVEVVQGSALPMQLLFNTVEGGGRTLSLGDHAAGLADGERAALGELSLVGRLLQGHFSPDFAASTPVDIEWVIGADGAPWLLQIRPYAG